MSLFSPESSVQAQPELIPAGTLVKALLVCKGVKASQNTGANYVNVELRVSEGPLEGRVFFDMIMDPFHDKASDGGRKMGILALTRIGEAIGMFDVSKPESYNRYADPKTTIFDVVRDIDGGRVAVKVKVEKGTDGHADKNKVGEWLTPNPNSGSGHKGWADLHNGPANPPARAAFGAATAAAAPTAQGGTPGWLTKPTGSSAPATPPPATEDKPPF